MDRFSVTLRISGEDLDPDYIAALLRCAPANAERKGVPVSTPRGKTRIPKKGRWSLTIDSNELGERDDFEDAVKMLLARLPSDPQLWASLTGTYAVDIFCGLFLASSNRGLSISPGLSKLLSDRRIQIGFDVYFDGPR